MKRRLATACAFAIVAAGLAVSTAAPHPSPVLASRSFTMRADAFPIEPAPGSNGVALGIRPAATRLVVANPPVEAYARAAAADLTAIEQQVGPPPAGTAAECDSASANLEPRAAATPAGMTLSARCDGSPHALASATARKLVGGDLSVAAIESTVSGGLIDNSLVGTARAVLSDLTVGMLHVGTARFSALVRTNGKPRGATAEGTIEVLDATIGGIPVTIGASGVGVDQTRVPADQVDAATAAVHDGLSQGGYADIRLVQPREQAAADGSSASLTGGGVLIYFTNNDPSATYFVGLTLLGGSVRVDVGSALDLAAVAFGIPPTKEATGPSQVSGSVPPGVQQPPARAVQVDGGLFATRARYSGPEAWDGWIWLLVGGGVLLCLAWATRRRFAPWWNAAADRYLRG